ncbi:hydrolase [uncultured Limosilactobacillus sp.]|uniref:hydrolase n=1 Tax=uncultured Limosilactobacillus sp. TaxID=2837629 RepID=UPI0025D4FDA7|nr:hydrolase [uncultured Limosilactobacillus sp.]
MTDSLNNPPQVGSKLRHQILQMPKAIQAASGIAIYGRVIRSLIFSTDLAIIKNCDADAVFAVYPFTPQQAISKAIIEASSVPVFCGCGGGTTKGVRTVSLAKDVESQGALAVVLNAPITNLNLRTVTQNIDIPTVITVVNPDTDIDARIRNGAAMINVAGGKNTAQIVAKIRHSYPELPIIASGGKSEENIQKTIQAGANAIVYTPPTSAELFSSMMDTYREPAVKRPIGVAIHHRIKTNLKKHLRK